jgi:hypothetical protein
MMGTPMGPGVFDKVVDATKQLGVPIVVAGILLWYMITKVDGTLVQVHDLMAEGRATQLAMQSAQAEIKSDVRAWMAQTTQQLQACRPVTP